MGGSGGVVGGGLGHGRLPWGNAPIEGSWVVGQGRVSLQRMKAIRPPLGRGGSRRPGKAAVGP